MTVLSALEKTLVVLREIDEASKITPKGREILLDVKRNAVFKSLDRASLDSILAMFKSDHKVIKITRRPYQNFTDDEHIIDCYGFKKTDKFDAYYELKKSEMRAKGEGTKNKVENPKPKSGIGSKYWVTYSYQTRKIILNDSFLLANPDFDSENELVFSHLYKNPNKKITRNELEKAIGQTLKKTFHETLRDLGFKKDLLKAFFQCSQDSIMFKPSVDEEDMKDLGLPLLRLP